MDSYYPVMLRLKNRLCTVIGGGHVAKRKLRGLLDAGAEVRAVAPQMLAGIEKLENIEIRRKKYEPQDLDGSFIVIAATDDAELNKRILSDAAERGMLAMSVEGGGDFINGAVRREGSITVQASSGVPALSAQLCRDLKLTAYAAAAELLSKYRRKIKRGDYEELLSERALRLAAQAPEEYEKLIMKYAEHD